AALRGAGVPPGGRDARVLAGARHRRGALDRGAGGRSRGVALQAGGGGQGLEPPDSGPWRRAGPARLALLRGAGGGGDVPRLRGHLMIGVAVLGSPAPSDGARSRCSGASATTSGWWP